MPQNDNKNGLHDSGIGWAIILACLFLVFLLFWKFFQYPIKSAFRWFRYGEMKVIGLFLGKDYQVHWPTPQSQGYSYHEVANAIAALPANQLNGPTLEFLNYVALYPVRYEIYAAFAVMATWAFLFGPGTTYKRKLDLNGLIRAQANNFPVIAPFVKFNPQNQPARPPGAPVPAELPAFAEALSPEEWIAHNELPAPDGAVDSQAAFMAFADQLGPRWEGAMKLAPYKQVLLAAFCLKAARKRTESDDMLGRLAQCWTFEKGLRLEGGLLHEAQKILRSRDLAEKTLAKCNQHAFETTAMLRALLTAREEGGVLAPAAFVWLRAHDRRLWYPLNNLGRQSFHMEAVGAMCHFKAERLTRRPIPRPKVQDAVKSIVDYMRSPRARPVPPLDYGKNKSGVKKPA